MQKASGPAGPSLWTSPSYGNLVYLFVCVRAPAFAIKYLYLPVGKSTNYSRMRSLTWIPSLYFKTWMWLCACVTVMAVGSRRQEDHWSWRRCHPSSKVTEKCCLGKLKAGSQRALDLLPWILHACTQAPTHTWSHTLKKSQHMYLPLCWIRYSISSMASFTYHILFLSNQNIKTCKSTSFSLSHHE